MSEESLSSRRTLLVRDWRPVGRGDRHGPSSRAAPPTVTHRGKTTTGEGPTLVRTPSLASEVSVGSETGQINEFVVCRENGPRPGPVKDLPFSVTEVSPGGCSGPPKVPSRRDAPLVSDTALGSRRVLTHTTVVGGGSRRVAGGGRRGKRGSKFRGK